jgi:phage-related baseplate assembly protein
VSALPAPQRAEQAPWVSVQQVLEADSLLGRRVRVAGRCLSAGEGRAAGYWTLAAGGSVIEVRGLVPPTCYQTEAVVEPLTIFAQVVPKAPGSADRLLLRLPD